MFFYKCEIIDFQFKNTFKLHRENLKGENHDSPLIARERIVFSDSLLLNFPFNSPSYLSFFTFTTYCAP